MRDKPTPSGLGVMGYASVAWVAFGAALAGAQPPPAPLPAGRQTTAPSENLGDAGNNANGPAPKLPTLADVQQNGAAGSVAWEEAAPAPIDLWRGVTRVGILVPATASNAQTPTQPAPAVKLVSATEPAAVAPAAPSTAPSPPAATVEVKIVNAVEREAGQCTVTVPLPAEPKTPPAANPYSANEYPGTADHHDETPATVNSAAHDGGWAPALAAFAGALLMPLVLLAGLFLMLRHLLGKSGPVIRVEYAGGQASLPLDLLAGLVRTVAPPPAPPTPRAPPALADPEPTTGENFDIGPTYEGERLMRDHQADDPHAGLVQQLFEDNVVLQKLLRESAGVSA